MHLWNKQTEYLAQFFFLLFFFGCTIILMNMFIAVISDVYINLQKENIQNWEYELSDTLTKSIVSNGKITAVDYIVQWFLQLIRTMFPPPKKEQLSSRVDLELMTITQEGNSEEMKEVSYSQIPTESNLTQNNIDGKELEEGSLQKSTDSKTVAQEQDNQVYEETFLGYTKAQLKEMQQQYRRQRKTDITVEQLANLHNRQANLQDLVKKLHGDLRVELEDIREEMKLIAQKSTQEIHMFKSESKLLQQEIRNLLESIAKK